MKREGKGMDEFEWGERGGKARVYIGEGSMAEFMHLDRMNN